MSNSDSINDNGSGAQLLARLNRLPVMGMHYLWALLLAINLMLEYYDNAIFAYASPTIKSHTNYSTEQIGLIGSMFFVGMIIGALIGGRLSDKFGRRSIMVWATILYSFGSLLTAISTNYEMMLFSRTITGVGVQAATSVLLVYVSEMFPSNTRGRFMSVVTIGFAFSAVAASALALFYLPNSGANAWRHLFYVGSIGFIIAPFMRFYMPESVRWYIARKKLPQAEALIKKFESKAISKNKILKTPNISAIENYKESTLSDLFRNKAVISTIIIVGIGYFGSTLAYYLFGNWAVYSFVYGLKYSEEKAYYIFFLWNVIYCITPFITMYILDRFERKSLILAISALTTVPLIILGISNTTWELIAAGGVACILTGIIVSGYYTYIPEAIPTKLRALGSGIIISIGRFGGAISGVLGAWLFTHSGIQGVMFAAAALYILFAIPVMLYGPLTTNRSLEVVNSKE
ncbi:MULTISPECIES: MFS transporter [Acinetobacter calcoaceticus/baumannii complex]|uniref:MFS transporter n=1 Tax=Acinetobacter calcoaceticus/baumannii complex TaxID=909768 RepID=UPI00083AD5E2|nr:MFS transporter [Acinetobacter pittii]OCZ69276.1 MFS transporter [Acinetobacter pittii]